MQKYVNINEKHIIQYSDFETLEDLIKRIKIVLENGRKENYQKKVEFNNGKFKVILAKSKNGEFVITAFNYITNGYQKLRSLEEQEKKRKELNL